MEEMNEDWENCCPLCMEEMDSTDRQLKPCRCGYQICVWCWHHIMEMAEKDSTEGRCPACRTPYDKEKIVSTAVSCDRFADTNEKKQKPGKAKIKAAEGRKNLSNVRVIQRNLVYVVGIPAALADEETLERKEYFGQYGRIFKISVSKTSGHSSQHSSAGSSVSVYVTYVKEEDALRCIQAVNGYVLEGKVLKACFGTTKYCNAWLKHMPCNNPDCLYLHDEGTREDSFTKEEMLAKYGSKNQHFHDLTHPPLRRSGIGLPPPVDVPSFTSTSNVPQVVSQSAPSVVGSTPKGIALVGNLPKSSSLPAAASWGSRSSASSSRPVSGRSGVGPVASKPKTGTGLITLATVSGSYASGQSSNSYDGMKQSKLNHIEGGQTPSAGPSRLLERTNCVADPSAILQTEAFATDADEASADVDASGQDLDGLISHKRNLSNAEANIHSSATSKELKLVEPSSLHKFAEAEESGVGVDILTGKVSSRITPLQETCEKSSIETSAPLCLENPLLDQHESGMSGDTGIMPHGSFSTSNLDRSTNQELFADSRTSLYDPENGLQQGLPKTSEVHSRLQTHFLIDKVHNYSNASDVSGQSPSNMNLSIFPRSDHAIGSTENFEDVQCNIPSKDPWSISTHSVNSEETASYIRDEATLLSEISSHTEQRDWKGETHANDTSTKEPSNDLSEHELISDMFSPGFDLWTDGSPQDLVHLLFNGKKIGIPSTTPLTEVTPPWKPSTGSKQSRFHFARQDEVAEGMLLQASGNDRHSWMEKHNRSASGNVSSSLGEVSTGEQFLSGATPSHSLNPKSPMMAPPGFSSRAAAVPPPGFSQHKPPDSRRLAEVRHEPARSAAPSSIYNHLDTANNSADVEFIDPAIMAVGRGKLPAGSRPAIPFASSPLSAFLSQAAPLSQQPRSLDFDSSYQAHQDRQFRNYGSLNSVSQLGYSNQDLDTASSSLFHSSFNDAINQPRLMGQYHDTIIPHVVMQDSVYGNGGHGGSKLRFQQSPSWDDWNRLAEGNTAGQQSVNDTVGRLAMSHLSLDRVLQSRLEELALSKDLGSKYFGDAAIPSGHDDQGPLNSARIGRYYLQH